MPFEMGEELKAAGLNPETGEADGASAQTESQAGVAQEQAAGQESQAQAEQGASGTQTPAGAAATQSQAEQQAWSLRQALQQAGMKGEWADDKAAWDGLQQQLRVIAQERQEYARQLATYQHYLQQLQAQQQQAAQPAPAPAPSQGEDWWKPPQWNEADLQFLARDEKGNIVAAPGAPPDLPFKYQQYQRWQAETMAKFLRDPIGTIRPGLEKVVRETAEKIAAEKLQGYDERQYATQFVQGQQAWMYELDQNKQPLRDTFGRPVLSPAGQAFASYVQYAQGTLGIRDVRQQQQYAQAMVERDALARMYGQQGAAGAPAAGGAAAQNPAQANEDVKRQALAGGARRLPGAGGGGQAPTRRPDGRTARAKDLRLSFGDRLKENLKQGGYQEIS